MRGEFDYADTQGLVRFGYKRMTEAAYLLVRVRDTDAARAWLRSAPVTSAVASDPPPATALQVAFTASGLRALGLGEGVLAGFSHEFLGGITEPSRSRRLGDIGRNAPAQWQWGASPREAHLLVMFFAEPGRLEVHLRAATGRPWTDGFEVLRSLDTADLGGIEPFGFADGLSQPQIDWRQEWMTTGPQLDYSNVVAVGEFLLGYRNEYGKYTDRPLLAAERASAELLPAEDAPEKKDLGRNGTYLVLRTLRQDVRRFWQFVAQHAGANRAAADQLAAAMVGRTRQGDPLVPIQKQPIPGIETQPDQIRQNQFTFDQDPAGALCPFGAHIRRANPRNADYPGRPTGLARLIATIGLAPPSFRGDLISAVRFHRILRRGREYGPSLTPVDALAPAPANDPERGLHFICLNANISRQFEFLQNAWVASTKFSGLTGESDPLLGTRGALPGCPSTDGFTVPRVGGLRQRLSGLPQFVTVQGGAYFFLPSLRALRYFADAGAGQP